MSKKWTISFVCEAEKDKAGNPKPDGNIVMRVNWSNNLVRYSLGYRAVIDKWDKSKQLCKNNTTHNKQTSMVINDKIKAYHTKADDILTEYQLMKNRIPTDTEFRSEFGKSTEKQISFFEVFDLFLESGRQKKDWSKTVYNKFNALKNHLLEYDKKITLDFNIDNAEGLIKYYKTKTKKVQVEEKDTTGKVKIKETEVNVYRNSTIKKNCAFLKWFLRWAYNNGYYTGNVHSAWDYSLKGTNTSKEIIYLEWDEVMTLWKFTSKLESLNRVKDVFLFQCFTGLRYSDVVKLKKSDINGDALHVVTQKTSDPLSINLNEFSRAILNKYENVPFKNGLALPVISNQKTNKFIKDLCKEAGINAPHTDVYFIGAERIEETKPKWEWLSDHAGRRTFVVTSLALGIDPLTVMKWTGHSTMGAMKPYIAIVDKSKKDGANKFNKLFADSIK